VNQLILFDIDGTLLWPQKSGALAMERALTEVFGTSGALHKVSMAGMTDRAILRQAFIDGTLSPQEIEAKWEHFTKAMESHLTATVKECDVQPCPGVIPLLDNLAARQDLLLGLVTGNLQNTAPIKLHAAGIDPHLFRIGGYGSDDSDRNKLPALAAHRAWLLTGHTFTGPDIVVVGDTPADVAAGKAVGARTVVVATGSPSTETLRTAKPDCLLPDLSDLEHSLQAILKH
jgi:phosphoglycolate phosphatase-like HAD superfamily hydrolase